MKRFMVLIVLMVMFMFLFTMTAAYAGSPKAGVLHKNTDMQSRKADSSLSGTVREIMHSGGYTYVKIEKDGKDTWVAIPKSDLSVGQTVSFAPGMVMNNFTSKTLNRSFDAIVFSGGLVGSENGAIPKRPSGHKQMAPSAEKKTEVVTKVEKATGPDAYTVAELHEKISELDSKQVTVRGRVVKVSPAIMGKNWVHLRDGSGNESKGTHDMLITSQDLPSLGDIVTAKGTMYKDRDFGSGYKYPVIMEEARIKK